MYAFEKSQEKIDGSVVVSIYKGNVNTIGRHSPVSLYDQALSSMDVEGGYNAIDSLGFIRINAIRLKAHNIVLKKRKPYNWRIKD
jgi:argininosuccinate synthase